MIIDKSGAIFDDRRKGSRREEVKIKENKTVAKERRSNDRRKK